MLTLYFLMSRLRSTPTSLSGLIRIMESFLSPYFDSITRDQTWVHELEMLGAVSVQRSHLGGLKPFPTILLERYPSLVSQVFPADLNLGGTPHTPATISSTGALIEASEGNYKLVSPNVEALSQVLAASIAAPDELKKVLRAIQGRVDPAKRDELEAAVKKSGVLGPMAEAWANLNPISFTAIGLTAVYANMKRRGQDPANYGVSSISEMVKLQ